MPSQSEASRKVLTGSLLALTHQPSLGATSWYQFSLLQQRLHPASAGIKSLAGTLFLIKLRLNAKRSSLHYLDAGGVTNEQERRTPAHAR